MKRKPPEPHALFFTMGYAWYSDGKVYDANNAQLIGYWKPDGHRVKVLNVGNANPRLGAKSKSEHWSGAWDQVDQAYQGYLAGLIVGE